MDSRRYKRVPFKRAVKFKVKGHEAFSGNVAQDISQGGLRFLSPEFLPINTEVTVQFQLKDNGKVMDLLGRVKWTRMSPMAETCQLGIEFFGDSEFQRSIIAQFVQAS